jgi:hypothetical protein
MMFLLSCDILLKIPITSLPIVTNHGKSLLQGSGLVVHIVWTKVVEKSSISITGISRLNKILHVHPRQGVTKNVGKIVKNHSTVNNEDREQFTIPFMGCHLQKEAE